MKIPIIVQSEDSFPPSYLHFILIHLDPINPTQNALNLYISFHLFTFERWICIIYMWMHRREWNRNAQKG